MSGLTFGTDYNQVSTWDSASGAWKHWLNDSQFNDFTEFQYGKTYEIYNNSGSDKTLSVTGITNGADLTHNIVSGDNFISPAVKSATNITTVLSGLTQGTHYSDVKRFNATTQAWESYAGGAYTQFEPGKGYNIIGLTNASFSYGKTETITTFVYDHAGQRVKKTVGGTTTTYLGKDYDVTGSTSTKYIFLGDRRISTKDSSGTHQFIHDDHISSSNVITDSSGNQAGLYEYDPYGSTVTHTGSASVKHQFTGQENDDSTRLYYYGARYYDPQLGRFITPDWYVQDATNPQTFNRYAYALNNPIKFTDPTGNFAFFAFLAFVGKVAAVVAGVTAVASVAAQALGANRLASTLAKISQIASYVSMGANAIGAALAPAGTPQAFIESVTQHPEFVEVKFVVQESVQEGTRGAFSNALKTQLKEQLDGFVQKVIESKIFSTTVQATHEVATLYHDIQSTMRPDFRDSTNVGNHFWRGVANNTDIGGTAGLFHGSVTVDRSGVSLQATKSLAVLQFNVGSNRFAKGNEYGVGWKLMSVGTRINGDQWQKDYNLHVGGSFPDTVINADFPLKEKSWDDIFGRR